MDPRLWSTSEAVVFFPVRHHSPACARLVAEAIHELRPGAVLIEGPADFNPRISELLLPHEPPLAIYSYFSTAAAERRGAFYPFCDFSPEWVALRTAHECGVSIEFIDLPWAEVAPLDRTANRYADGRLGRSPYTADLCRRLGVDDWNTLWDTLFEIEPTLDLGDFLRRCHTFCFHARVAEGGASPADLAREAHMLARIRAAIPHTGKLVLVVTGGFHSSALFAGLHDQPFESAPTEHVDPIAPITEIAERGLALTPYSYERLDALTGYEAGLPNPGFYHRIWTDRSEASGGSVGTYRTLLARAATALRARGQVASTADLIGVETFAQGIAMLRGHAEVWRTDLVDALIGTLVKDEFAVGGRHPFLEALHEVLRGSARGRLAPGTPLPPLVDDIANTLQRHDLEPPTRERRVDLELEHANDRQRSHVLHRVRLLGLPGFNRVAGTDFVARADLSRLWETWTLRWSPEFEASCIERALYGASLLEATGARLAEQGSKIERDAEAAARLLLDASLAGWDAGFLLLRDRVVSLVRADASFASVAGALGHLYYLHRYEEAISGQARAEVAVLLTESYTRATWLLEAQSATADQATVHGLRALLQATLTAGDSLGWDRTELLAVLHRIGGARETPALLRGAAAGALWSLGCGNLDAILAQIPTTPEVLGDFLQGVFALAREEAQRHTELLVVIDRLLLGFDSEQFLVALPALRLAFTYFTPREKDHLARRLLTAVGQADTSPLPALAVSTEEAARALGFEARLLRELGRHGIRGGVPPPPR